MIVSILLLFVKDKTFLGHQLNLPVISMKKSGENFANDQEKSDKSKSRKNVPKKKNRS